MAYLPIKSVTEVLRRSVTDVLGSNLQFFWTYPNFELNSMAIKAICLALLSVPQLSHYILDGFIWKFNHRNPDLKKFLLPTN